MPRLTAHFTGRVQGVGFRFTTVNVARSYAVAGYVQNLPDGRVQLIAEGTAKELRAFLQAVQQSLGRNITDTQSDITEAINEFSNPTDPNAFTVRY
jgi:acylphosphatase